MDHCPNEKKLPWMADIATGKDGINERHSYSDSRDPCSPLFQVSHTAHFCRYLFLHKPLLFFDVTSQLSRHVLVDILRGDHSLEKSLGDDEHDELTAADRSCLRLLHFVTLCPAWSLGCSETIPGFGTRVWRDLSSVRVTAATAARFC